MLPMDPMTLMMIASNANPGGAANPLLNPEGSAPTTAMAPQLPGPQAGAPAPGAGPSLGDMLSGIQAPKAPDPKFSGGVSGSGLPYVSRMEDLVNPFLQATGANRPGAMPTLGSILSQAPGGGR